MRPDGGTKRQQEAVTNASADGDDGMSRKRMKSEPAMKEEAPDEERTLYDFNTVYDYLESTKPKCEFEDFATLKGQYIPLLVQPGDEYSRQHSVEQNAASEVRGQSAKLPKDGGIFFGDIPLHHRTSHGLHPLEEQRLRLCGLAIKKWRWSRDEDEILVENWREYAAQHGIPLRDASKFFGTTKEDSLDLRQSAQTTQFHPWMCKRLLHRTCEQIKRRGRLLFHQNYRLRGGNEMWTADDDELLLRHVKAHNGNFKEVALQMGRINGHCLKHYYWLQKHGAADDGTMLQAKKRRAGVGIQWSDEDAERLQHLLDRFGSQWSVVALWMDRSSDSCEQYAIKNKLKFERRRGRQMVDVERYSIEPWSADQLQQLSGTSCAGILSCLGNVCGISHIVLDFLRVAFQCNPVKFLRSEESLGIEHRIDWYAASEQTAKSPTECRVKWGEFKEYILEKLGNGCRKKEILPGLLQLSGALKQHEKVPRRKWTATQIHQLVDMVGEMGRRWKKIGRELNRGPRACMQQYYVYQGHSTDPAGEWTLDELRHFYGYLGDKLFWHPVEAARHRGGDRNILWKDASNVIGKSARDCQNMWKRLKTQFPVSQQHLQTHDVYKIAKHALQSCLVEVKEELAERDEAKALEGTEPPTEAVYDEEGEDGENDAPAPLLADVTPSQLSRCITILLEQDLLESKRDFDADWLQFNLHKTPALPCTSDDIVRHVRRMLRRCKRAGMWARLPQEQRSLRGKLEALEFVLSRLEELLVPSRRFRKLLKKFAEQGEFALLPRDDAVEEPDFVDLRLPSSSE
ncbi:hypothetical protein AAVH_22490 [Aphelenchoides avenae]|nr:hypothetical protein AAVH_22490 [Aphelenchus avenae]